MDQARRSWLQMVAAGGLGLGAGSGLQPAAAQPAAAAAEGSPIFIATWKFGQAVADAAAQAWQQQADLLGAIERGIWVAEEDATNASVGLGGAPNADGVVQLDACIMQGKGHRAGAVAALEGILHPISVARRVMEQTPHVMLVGAGARQFALNQGFPETNLLTEERRKAWETWKKSSPRRRPNPAPPQDDKNVSPDPDGGSPAHDTITLLGCLPGRELVGGCSTSGWAYKLPGRVGDSPLIGGGLYVDNEVGAAGATGLGENIMRFCGSFLVVELMRSGATPSEACAEAVRRILRKWPAGENPSVNFLALDRAGRSGAAGTDDGFCYAIRTAKESRIELPKILGRS